MVIIDAEQKQINQKHIMRKLNNIHKPQHKKQTIKNVCSCDHPARNHFNWFPTSMCEIQHYNGPNDLTNGKLVYNVMNIPRQTVY